MKHWAHRISHCNDISEPMLINHGILTIGWSDMDPNIVNSALTKDQIFDLGVQIYGGNPFPTKNQTNCLYNFLYEFKKDDIILVLSKGMFLTDQQFMIVQIIDEQAEAFENFPIDLGFFHRVKILRNVSSRDLFSDDLRNALIQPTNFSLDRHANEIDALI